MTGLEIRNAAEVYTGKPIPDDVALLAINEALAKLGDMGLLYGEITVEAKAGEVYYLPADLLHIFVIYDLMGQPYENYHLAGDRIVFRDSGTYTIVARKLAKPLEKLNAIPDVNEAYHNVLVSYLRAFVMQMYSENPADKNMRFDRFEYDAAQVFKMLRRRRMPKEIKVVR